jgi:Ubiquitin-activating enzyme E1 four-helix bundle
VTQVKETKVGKHRPLAECLTQPGEFLLSDFSKIERPQLLHVAFQALENFRGANRGRHPQPGDKADIEAFRALCGEVNGSRVRALVVCCTCSASDLSRSRRSNSFAAQAAAATHGRGTSAISRCSGRSAARSAARWCASWRV